MKPPDGTRPDPSRLPERHSGPTAYDRQWTRHLRGALASAAVLLGALLLIDWAATTLTPWRGALWLVLAALLFLMLCPPRVAAGTGWLETRFLLRTRRVRTDLLVSVRCSDGIAQRLVLRDALGARVELDPRVLVANPELWHRLDEDAQRAQTAGALLCGRTALDRLGRRVDRETAHAVFRVSGLEDP
ncbi:hypothetical protein ACIG0D_20575 [Streptomyces sp. NPDC052773]|uniref:hypothetical protein n=1 Tax=Streptomyces sp. NPDC052773 TaxID=3365693 RepID=UPI0037D5D3A3